MLYFFIGVLNLRFFDIISHHLQTMEKIRYNLQNTEKKIASKNIFTSQTIIIHEPEIANSGWIIVL